MTHSVTCGAVNADCTIAPAIILRTPLIGSRYSRSPVATGCTGAMPIAASSHRGAAARGRLDVLAG